MQDSSAINFNESKTEVLSLANDYSEITGSSIPWYHVQLIIPGTGEVLLVDVDEEGFWQAQPNYPVPNDTQGSISIITIDQEGNAIEALTITPEPITLSRSFNLIEPVLIDDVGEPLVQEELVESATTEVPLGSPINPFAESLVRSIKTLKQAHENDGQEVGLIKVHIDGFVVGGDQLALKEGLLLPEGVKVMVNSTTGNLLISGIEKTDDVPALLEGIKFVSQAESIGERHFTLSLFSTDGKPMIEKIESTIELVPSSPQLVDFDSHSIVSHLEPTLLSPSINSAFEESVNDKLDGLIDIDRILTRSHVSSPHSSFEEYPELINISNLLVGNNEMTSLNRLLTIITEGDNTVVEVDNNNTITSYQVKTDDIMNDEGALLSDEGIIQHLIDENKLIIG